MYTKEELSLQNQGLVDIQSLCANIQVQLVYSTPNNFMDQVLYHNINHAFMLPELAEKVVDARKLLKSIRPDLNFIIYDAARPISIQYLMWEKAEGTPIAGYVCDPTKGQGLHNFGAAVDITLIDSTGRPLPMGSEYDYFGIEARSDNEDYLLANNRITQRELENRQLLRKVMTEQGLLVFDYEWWHFNLVTPEEAVKSLKLIK